jgi:sigma-B regulation protein RsbU (phosphoserine phosphatase)
MSLQPETAVPAAPRFIPRQWDSASEILSLTLPNKLASCETARLALDASLAGFDLSAKVLYKLELVLEETMMNLVWHAFEPNEVHSIDFKVAVTAAHVWMRFEDQGKPFDPRTAAEPVQAGSIEEATPGGLGLVLVRRSVASMDHEWVNGRNCLTLAIER